MSAFGAKIGRAQSIVSRLCAGKHRADPQTAVRIIKATKGKVHFADLYGLDDKFRCKVCGH